MMGPCNKQMGQAINNTMGTQEIDEDVEHCSRRCSFLTALNPVIVSYSKLAALSITELNKLVTSLRESIPTNISTVVR